jgi:hypothetical protein
MKAKQLLQNLCITAILLVGSIQFSKAQLVPVDIQTRITNSDYIFEGEVIHADGYWNVNRTFIYTAVTIDVIKTFKGGLKCGYLELIAEGGSVGDTSLEISHNLILEKSEVGLFMCQQTAKESPMIDYFPLNDSTKVDAKYGQQSFIKYYKDSLNFAAADLMFNFDSLAQVYDVVQLYAQLQYSDCYPHRSVFEVQNERYEQEQKKVNALSDGITLERVDNVSTLTFTLQNQQITTSGGNNYFEFDIALSDDVDPSFLYQVICKVDYDASVFGSNLVANNKVWVTKDLLMLDDSTYLNPTASDNQANRLNISIFALLASQHPAVNLYELTSVPVPAVHVKMQIADCSAQGYVSPLSTTTFKLYASTNHPSSYINYDAVNAVNNSFVPGCSINVTGISPQSVRGGIGEVVTISGSGFGNSQGNVFLKNAEDGGGTYLALDSMDFLSWTNTQIQFTLPSIIDSNGTGHFKYTPGSGHFGVRNNLGLLSDTASSPILTIRYATRNTIDPGDASNGFTRKKHFVNLINRTNLDSGYTFRMDTNFSHFPARLNCLSTAMHDWVCMTGVKFKMGNDTTIVDDTIPKNDGVNYIEFNSLPIGTFAQTYLHIARQQGTCNNGWVYETDMVVNNNYTFTPTTNPSDNIPAGTADLYHILLHEFGHAHSLQHVNDPTQMMWWASTSGGIPAALRVLDLIDDTSASEGGHRVIQTSLNFNPANCDPGSAVISVDFSNCSSWAGVHDLENFNMEFLLYPNPSDKDITIKYSYMNSTDAEIEIYDYLGKMVYNRTSKKESSEEKINIESFSAGCYLIKVSANGKEFIKKLIKQ